MGRGEPARNARGMRSGRRSVRDGRSPYGNLRRNRRGVLPHVWDPHDGRARLLGHGHHWRSTRRFRMTTSPRIAVAVASLLGIVVVPACGNEHCTGPGVPLTCSIWKESQCPRQPGCFWGTGCVLAVRCDATDQAACEAFPFCHWKNSGFCAVRADPCMTHTSAECTTDPNCAVAPACVGTPVACESHQEENECRQDLNCGWSSEPAF